MDNGPDLPRELSIWTAMTYQQRHEVMMAVGRNKSLAKWHRSCLAHIKANMDKFATQNASK